MIAAGSLRVGGISVLIVFGYMVVIMIAVTISTQKTIFIVAAGCILSVILIAVAETNGLLPAAVKYSPTPRAIINIIFFLIVILLQNIKTVNTRELILQAQQSETQYQSLLENIPATTYINTTGKNARTVNISPQAENLLEYPHKAFTDDPMLWAKILHPDDKQRVMDESDRTAETGDPFKCEYRVITNDRNTLWLKPPLTGSMF